MEETREISRKEGIFFDARGSMRVDSFVDSNPSSDHPLPPYFSLSTTFPADRWKVGNVDYNEPRDGSFSFKILSGEASSTQYDDL